MQPGPTTDDVHDWYLGLQERLCARLEAVDGVARFVSETWERPGGGGGDTRVLQGDGPLEKAAVNVSAVWGDTPPGLSERLPRRAPAPDAGGAGGFFATGISMIVHPRNPHAPTCHANLRHFVTDGGAWFGGGVDLTPYFLYPEDAVHFHRSLAAVCHRHDVADHGAWKRACDDYFRLPHRGEARGIGGIFFDHVTGRPAEVWAFQQDLGDAIAGAYLPIVERRAPTPFGPAEEEWHLRRRGRYVEFNLVWDRGTRFGLETGGRIDSILASLPPRARWDHVAEPGAGSPEAELLDLLTGPPRDWLA
jgi:coproporphyrinogen III oxidase